jgi:large subunit ribosomal protein L9
MEVILLSDHSLGEAGKILKVANGFAKNYLIPKRIAIPATQENKDYFVEKKQMIDQNNEELLHRAQELLASMVHYKLPNFIRHASDDNKLFGSVSKRDIASLIAEDFPSITHENILLANPLKTLGVFKVLISVHPKLKAIELIANIARSEQEAAVALDRFSNVEKIVEAN